MQQSRLTPLCPSFRSAPGPGLLFLSDAHRQVVDGILEATGKPGPVLLVLTGDAGTGKTVLARHLALSCKDRHAALIGNCRTQLMNLNHHLPQALGLAPSAAFADPETGPQAMAEACRDSGRRSLLIVDEAQGLPDPALTCLERLIMGPGDIALLLVGGPDLEGRLARPGHDGLRTRIDTRFRLLAFDQADTAAYVAHRFRVPGCPCHAGAQVFDAAGIAQLHALSKGVPRIINHLVQSCLFEARSTGRTALDGAFVRDCMSSLLREGRLSHLLGGAVLPPRPRPAVPGSPTLPPLDRPAMRPAPAPREPAPATPGRERSAPSQARTFRTGAMAMLAAALILVPDQRPGTRQPEPELAGLLARAPVQARSPLSRRVTSEDPPVPERLLTEGLALGGADPARAARLYARAALWGNARAAYYLGQLHETGVGVDPDPLRARAWYQAAAGIGGAAARLAELEASPPPAEPGAPVPALQIPLRTGQTELHWQAPAGAARFRVEFIPAGGSGQARQMDTPLTAALIDQPVQAWRVVALRRDGTAGPASAWSRLDPGPR